MKPNANSIARSKKLWERLRRKNHVAQDERDILVKELFDIITGQVRDFVFKHDAVRVVQCLLKYSNVEQRRQIAEELKGSYRELAESRYAKFLIAKLVVQDNQIRDMIVPEFYGHVKQLMRNSEASWIVDDIYRTLATKEQKAKLLREWYGPEFVIFGNSASKHGPQVENEITADLSKILQQNPEKRGPIMRHLNEMTNQMVQKKTTGFTMLHDAMLQYFLNTKPGSPEATEFLEMLRDDEGGDCLKNLGFTQSGSRLVCLALAYGSSKDRRAILKVFKTHMKLLAEDVWGYMVLIAAYEVIDDTVMVTKTVFPELLSRDMQTEQRQEELLRQVENLRARIPLLYPMSRQPPKWLLSNHDAALIQEIKEIRVATSKKDPETRRLELVRAMSQPLLDLIASRADRLVQSSFGCQFAAEVMFGAIGDKEAASKALAGLVKLGFKDSLNNPYATRMLKMLVQGGPFDKATERIQPVEPALNFHNTLHDVLGESFEQVVTEWAFGKHSFIVVSLLEAEGFEHRSQLLKALKREAKERVEDSKTKDLHPGTRIMLEKIEQTQAEW